MSKIYISTSDNRFHQVSETEWWDSGEDGLGIDLVDQVDVDSYLDDNPGVGIIVKVEIEETIH